MDLILSLIREEPMASNMAARRAAKANRRKAIVAEKRKSEMFADTLAERVRRAASTPIRHCLLTDRLFEHGIGTLILTRGATREYLSMGMFLVDVFCLGIKDAAFRTIAGSDFDEYIAAANLPVPAVPVDPGIARKLLREVATWSESIGFAPHRDFAVIEQLFGDASAAACDAAFQFGRDGKPFYMASPSETPAQVRHRIEQLRARLGNGGFHFIAAA